MQEVGSANLLLWYGKWSLGARYQIIRTPTAVAHCGPKSKASFPEDCLDDEMDTQTLTSL